MRFGSVEAFSRLEGRLIDLIYASLVDETAWGDFLREIAACTPNGQSTLFFHDQLRATGSISLSHGIDPEFQRLYPHYAPKNLWMQNLHKRPVGLGVRSEYMTPLKDVERSEYYQELLKPFGIQSGIGITLQKSGTQNFMLSVIGAAQDEAIEQRAADMLTHLAPHLTRVFTLYRRIPERAPTAVLAQSLSAFDVGVLTVGSGKSIHWSNEAARALLAKGDGIGVDPADRIRMENDDLEAALLKMLDPIPSDDAARTVTGYIRRRAGSAPPLKVMLANSGRSLVERYFAGPTVIMLLDARRSQRSVSLGQLVSWFDLTPREAEIAMDLADGLPLRTIADKRGISHETVRIHLKHIFAKAGVRRQTELVTRIFRMDAGSSSE